ncbi:histidine phosphatase family protein [Candidatus Poribacteria bacterium]|jgi:phosphohistidine phosphatase|nr:histidine phosphatase family protein [Candidatus Poribacteria bacterium]MBT7804437.1 histidine phosphatase family protein [Candidatus Poribacteria bacterium]
MKTLLILRHAKSSWDDSMLRDHDRPLNKRGKRDAPRMGRLLTDEGLVPDIIVTSTARRAVDTAELVAEAAQYTGEILRDESLYGAPASVYLDVLQSMDDANATVMLVGHNPAIEHLVGTFGSRPERMPTAALARVRLQTEDWAAADPSHDAELVDVWRPKELP